MREIARWPAWEVRLLQEYLAKEPAGIDRMEVLAARFAAMYFNFNSSGATAKFETNDFLHYRQAFKLTKFDAGDDRYSDLDREIFSALNR